MPFDPETNAILRNYGFDELTFEALRARLRRGDAERTNQILGTVEPPSSTDLRRLAPKGSAERRRLEALGEEALRDGQVGAIFLAGGMATRFGGVVKASVPVVADRSFLDLKLADIWRAAERIGARIPTFLMTSFASDRLVRELADTFVMPPACPVHIFAQFVSLRLTPEGEIFRQSDGRPSLYAPGHGDLTFAMRRAGQLRDFREQGGRLLLMSNVDNLGATLDPAIIGAHIEGQASITVETVLKHRGDRGGAPARVDGRLQVVEAFRFPVDFDQDQIDVFNTNTFVLDAAAIDRDFDLSWFKVVKEVEDRPAVQFERLVGELTAFLPSAFLVVERGGAASRFEPVKEPKQLEARRSAIAAVLRERGVLPSQPLD